MWERHLVSFLRRLFGEQPAPAAPTVQESVPALRGNTMVEIVGESNYQQALARFAGPKTPTGVDVWKTADLVPEPRNPYDKNAVSVRIEGEVVGYLARAVAIRFHEYMASEGHVDAGLSDARAHIWAGWNRGSGDEGSYAVTLFLKSSIANVLNG